LKKARKVRSRAVKNFIKKMKEEVKVSKIKKMQDELKTSKPSSMKVKDEVKAEVLTNGVDADDDEDKIKYEIKNESKTVKKDQDLVLKKRTRK